MSMLAPVPDVPDDQVTLPITFPKEKERYDLNGKGLVTDLHLEMFARVRGTFTGVVVKDTFDGAEGIGSVKRKFVIIVDDCDIEPL